MSYEPIENYGVIGNMRTVALVGVTGSIDWLCVPTSIRRASSPRCWTMPAAGASASVPANEGVTDKQLYWPDTNVLVTRFLSPEGVGEIEDFMPVGPAAKARRPTRWSAGSRSRAAASSSTSRASRRSTTRACGPR